MRRLGVKVDLIGNIFGKKKDEDEPPQIEGTHAEIVAGAKEVAEEIDHMIHPEEKSAESKPLTKPKPKRSKKKK